MGFHKYGLAKAHTQYGLELSSIHVQHTDIWELIPIHLTSTLFIDPAPESILPTFPPTENPPYTLVT